MEMREGKKGGRLETRKDQTNTEGSSSEQTAGSNLVDFDMQIPKTIATNDFECVFVDQTKK
jgi:hypothetical protein